MYRISNIYGAMMTRFDQMMEGYVLMHEQFSLRLAPLAVPFGFDVRYVIVVAAYLENTIP